MADRVASAVQFLQDPAVSSAPLPQRIDFLKSKGLSEAEIEQSLAQAAQRSVSPQPFAGPAPHQHVRTGSDWRDWFVMSIVGGGAAFLLGSIAKNYLFPALQAPDASQLQEATAALEAKYDEAAEALEALKQDSEAVKSTLEAQSTKVDGAVQQVTDTVQDIQRKEAERDYEYKRTKEEIQSLRDLLNKANERHSKEQSASMAEVQAELKSLKALLASSSSALKKPAAHVETSSSPDHSAPGTPSLPQQGSSSPPDPPKFGITPFGKGGLPAWQLAGHNKLNQINGTGAATSSEADDKPSEPQLEGAKGEEAN